MPLAPTHVREVFENLETGDRRAFFADVADVEVRAYLDSALVARLFQDNPISEAGRSSGFSSLSA